MFWAVDEWCPNFTPRRSKIMIQVPIGGLKVKSPPTGEGPFFVSHKAELSYYIGTICICCLGSYMYRPLSCRLRCMIFHIIFIAENRSQGWCQYKRHDRHQFDQDVHGWT